MLRVGFDRLSAGLFTINSLYHYLKNISVSRLEFYAHHRLLLIYLLPLPFFSFFLSFYFIFVYRFRQLAVYSSTSNYKFYHYTAVRGSGSISETHVEKHHDVISRWYIKHISHHESNSNLWRSTQYIFFLNTVFFLSFILSSKFFRDCRRWIQQFYLKKIFVSKTEVLTMPRSTLTWKNIICVYGKWSKNIVLRIPRRRRAYRYT